jgi:predicted nucleotidyltransferase
MTEQKIIPDEVRAEIMVRLGNAEREHGVRILLAVESGSRAWGFHSPNSDYDVRFIYMRDPDWYHAVDLEERRDVIEYPIVDDIDLNGWDLRKALRLYWKSNPAFVEWIQSPIMYIETGIFAARARALLSEVYCVDRGSHH